MLTVLPAGPFPLPCVRGDAHCSRGGVGGLWRPQVPSHTLSPQVRPCPPRHPGQAAAGPSGRPGGLELLLGPASFQDPACPTGSLPGDVPSAGSWCGALTGLPASRPLPRDRHGAGSESKEAASFRCPRKRARGCGAHSCLLRLRGTRGALAPWARGQHLGQATGSPHSSGDPTRSCVTSGSVFGLSIPRLSCGKCYRRPSRAETGVPWGS